MKNRDMKKVVDKSKILEECIEEIDKKALYESLDELIKSQKEKIDECLEEAERYENTAFQQMSMKFGDPSAHYKKAYDLYKDVADNKLNTNEQRGKAYYKMWNLEENKINFNPSENSTTRTLRVKQLLDNSAVLGYPLAISKQEELKKSAFQAPTSHGISALRDGFK